MTNSTHALGVDVGGSHIARALINLTSGALVHDSYREQQVDPTLDREALLHIWIDFISNSMNANPTMALKGVGIGIPGEFDYTNGIALYDQNKFTQLYGVNIKEYFHQELNLKHATPINFINDASAFALGELWQGAAKGFDRVLMLTLGTGLGATFLQHEKVMTEGSGIPANGTLYDEVFAEGIADEYFSTRFFINEYFKRTATPISGAKELSDLAINGDAVAKEIFNDFGTNLAIFLKPFVDLAQTEVIILGGNIALAYALFQSTLVDGLSNSSIQIKTAALGNKGGIIGAASCFRAV